LELTTTAPGTPPGASFTHKPAFNMEDTFKFQFTETLQSSCPNATLEITFYGKATWVESEGRFAIDFVMYEPGYVSILIPMGFCDSETLFMQCAEGGKMGVFLSKCRTAAHKAATEAGFFDSEKPNLHKPVMRQEISEL